MLRLAPPPTLEEGMPHDVKRRIVELVAQAGPVDALRNEHGNVVPQGEPGEEGESGFCDYLEDEGISNSVQVRAASFHHPHGDI